MGEGSVSGVRECGGYGKLQSTGRLVVLCAVASNQDGQLDVAKNLARSLLLLYYKLYLYLKVFTNSSSYFTYTPFIISHAVYITSLSKGTNRRASL